MADAITSANTDSNSHNTNCTAGSGDDTITLTGNITITADSLPRISAALTINGGGNTLNGTKNLLEAGANRNPDNSYTDFILTINRLTVTNNSSTTSDNGVLYFYNDASVVINNSTFRDNKSMGGGAAIHALNSADSLTINNSTFSGNVGGSGSGGAIRYSGDTEGHGLTISNSIFSENEAVTDGGALIVGNAGFANISGSRFIANEAGDDGGAIRIASGGVSPGVYISNSVFRDNTANDEGGAISTGSPTNIFRSVFSGNESGGQAGAIFNDRNMRLENSTLYDNEADEEGGALYATSNSTTNIRHVTFVNNAATDSGKNGNSIFFHTSATARMYNSIVAQTDGATGTDCHYLDTNTNNIIEKVGSCGTTASTSVDPLLGGRAGDPAYYTLQAGSPAINAADPTQCGNLRNPVDQRGVSRPVGPACDIGAFEYVPPPPDSNGGGGGGGDDDDNGGEPTPTPLPRPQCYFCPDLQARGFRLNARYGLGSGVELRQVDRGGIGNKAVLDAGFMDAVDIYGFVEQGVEVCFPEPGSLILLDATTSPRAPTAVQSYDQDGLTCAAIDRPGTLVLVANPPANLPLLQSSVSLAPAATAVPAIQSRYQPLDGCMVTTQGLMRFRDAPGGAPLVYTDPWGRQENGWLAGHVTLTALERTADWFHVDYYGARGWVSAHHVAPHGACG